MNHLILKNKSLFTGIFIVTTDMLKSLSEINRSDMQNTEYESLIQNIFSDKKMLKQAGPLVEKFLVSEKNIAGKRYLLTQIGKTGSSAAVKFLSEMLAFDHAAELALMTLQEMPGAAVNKRLKKSVSKASPIVLPGILNALGKRKDVGAVKLISKYIHNEDMNVSGAAVSALGMIGTPDATAVLTKAVQSGTLTNQFPVMESLLDIAEQLISQNQTGRAYEIYKTLFSANPPEMIAVAALKGKMKTTSENPADIIKQELAASSDERKPEVIDLVKNLPESWKSGQLEVRPGAFADGRIAGY